jgi:hypothetical protein
MGRGGKLRWEVVNELVHELGDVRLRCHGELLDGAHVPQVEDRLRVARLRLRGLTHDAPETAVDAARAAIVAARQAVARARRSRRGVAGRVRTGPRREKAVEEAGPGPSPADQVLVRRILDAVRSRRS